MLAELQIKNLALIETADITFSGGLAVISGETGAGKSLLVEAVNLLLGARAGADRIRAECPDAVITGLFSLKPETATALDLAETELLLSRKLRVDGKSRCYVNGSLATVSVLAEYGRVLVDFHSQRQHQSLLKAAVQKEYLDQFAGSELIKGRQEFIAGLASRRRLKEKSAELRRRESDKEERRSFLTYQINEIDALNLQPDEDLVGEQELSRLRRHEQLERALAAATDYLEADETGALDRLQLAERELAAVSDLDDKLVAMRSETAALSENLSEILRRLRAYQENNQFDRQRLEWLEERLHTLNELKRKHGGTLAAVLEKRAKMGRELAELENWEAEIAGVERDLRELEAELDVVGAALSKGRRRAAAKLEKGVRRELAELAMKEADFRVEFTDLGPDPDAWTLDGREERRFFIKTNKGEAYRPLAKIASGGEISRIMLALKTVLAAVDKMPVLIFDEIDTGIGGQTANLVGAKLSALARGRQVICVTHLPQIAAYADEHFHLAKRAKGKRMVTVINKLDEAGRINELIRMLGADADSRAAFEHSKKFIEAARRYKEGGVIA